MSDKFSFERNDSDNLSAVILRGIIDEDALLEDAFKDIRPSAEIDIKGIIRINSCGIRTWVNIMADISARCAVEFVRCPPIMVRQFNMISNFGGNGKIVSFSMPYFCDKCDKEYDIDTTAEDYLRDNPQLTAPDHTCPSCGEALEFDDIEEKYFHFLKQQ